MLPDRIAPIQSSFLAPSSLPFLAASIGLSADSAERQTFLITLVLLHNFRVRTGRPNQIRTVYGPIIAQRWADAIRRAQEMAAAE